jgi:L-threonylcarbamoyladenylate synthase
MLVTTDVTIVAQLLLSRPGCVCAYPTETFYGMGAPIHDAAALNRIVAAKGRDALKGMIVLVSDMAMAATLALMDRRQKDLLERLWPAPVSVVLQAARALDPLLAPDGRVALRISPHGMATELVQRAGPVTSTSANRTGEPPARTGGRLQVRTWTSTPSWTAAGPRAGNPPPSWTSRSGRPCACGKGRFPFRRSSVSPPELMLVTPP